MAAEGIRGALPGSCLRLEWQHVTRFSPLCFSSRRTSKHFTAAAVGRGHQPGGRHSLPAAPGTGLGRGRAAAALRPCPHPPHRRRPPQISQRRPEMQRSRCSWMGTQEQTLCFPKQTSSPGSCGGSGQPPWESPATPGCGEGGHWVYPKMCGAVLVGRLSPTPKVRTALKGHCRSPTSSAQREARQDPSPPFICSSGLVSCL